MKRGVTEWFAESQNVSQIIWELESPDFNSCNAFTFYFEGATQMTNPGDCGLDYISEDNSISGGCKVSIWDLFFYCTKMLHHTETFITHQQHVTATRAHNPDNCDPWWRPLRHTYFFKKNSTDVWLDVKKTDFWRWYIKPITDIHGKKKPHQTLCGVCLFCSLKTLHVGNYNI